MIILGIKTDQPTAELWIYDDDKELQHIKWQAHLILAETIHTQIQKLLLLQGTTPSKIEGVVCFQGPGSFTGLRIGLSVANALVYAQNIPITARRGDNWLEQGIEALLEGQNDKTAIPYYDHPAAARPAKSP